MRGKGCQVKSTKKIVPEKENNTCKALKFDMAIGRAAAGEKDAVVAWDHWCALYFILWVKRSHSNVLGMSCADSKS